MVSLPICFNVLQTKKLSKLRHVVSCALETILLNTQPCKSATDFCTHHHLQLFHNFKAISTLTTSIQRDPIEKHQIQYRNSFEFYRFSRIIQDCIDARDLRTGSSIHTRLVKLDSNGFISLWNKLLNLYCNCAQIRHSRRLFDTMPERDVVSYNTLTSIYVRHNCDIVEALQLYSRMQEEDIKPNHITLAVLIGACASRVDSHLIELIQAQSIQYGLSSNEFIGSSLVDGYAKRMRLEEAIRAFDEITELDLVSWNIMIDGCARNGSKENALRIFSRLRCEGVKFDNFTLSSITKTCSEPRDLSRGMQLHGCAIKAGLASETPINNALVTMYSKCEEGMVSATKIFGRILAPNLISWTAMIAGFMQNGQNEEAVGFYQTMLREGMKENEFSFSSILPAYSHLARLEQGTQVHARIIKSCFGLDASVGNGLIDMYAKCGSLEDAKLVFTTMEIRDVVSWTVMITGLGHHGKGREALEILKTMTSEGFKPDAVTFLGVLSACSHCGLIDKGLGVFKSMIDAHNVKPRREHYACVVDMLGRAGRLNEAEKFIDDMRIESDGLVWEALLGACQIHGEMELGQRSAEKIMELEPKRDGPYVLLANIYADRGLWEDKGKLRERLGVGGLKKEAGRSWVTVQGTF